MDYVNERTGEVLEVEKVTLSNLSSGALSRMFSNELLILALRLLLFLMRRMMLCLGWSR